MIEEFGQLLGIYEVAFAGQTYICGKVKVFSRQLEDSKRRSADVEKLGSWKGRSFELRTVDTTVADPFQRSFVMISQLTGQVMLAPTDANLDKSPSLRSSGRCFVLPCSPVIKNDSLRSSPPVIVGAASGAAGAAAADSKSVPAVEDGKAAAVAAPAAVAPRIGAAVAPPARASASASSAGGVAFSADRAGLGLV